MEDVSDLGLKGLLLIPEEEDIPEVVLGDIKTDDVTRDLRSNGRVL